MNYHVINEIAIVDPARREYLILNTPGIRSYKG